MLKKNRIINFLLAFIFTIVSVFSNIIPVFAQVVPGTIANTSMISSRSEFGAVEVYGNVFIIGGINDSGFLNTVERYSGYSNSVSNESSMSLKRSAFGATAYKNKIYVIGGKTLNGAVANVEVYDTDSKTWSGIASMPVAKHSFRSTLLNGRIYTVGGVTSQGVSSTVEVYDIEKNTWSAVKNMPTARCNLSVTVYENKIYAIGGKTADGKVSNVVEVYDEVSNTWERKSNMLNAREGLSAAVLDNHIYALGGSNVTSLNNVEVYNPRSDKWYSTRNFSQTVANAELISVDNKLNVMGGKSGSSYLNMIKEYKPRLIEDILRSINKFSEASQEDKNIICSAYNTEASVIVEYESKGYSLSAILNSITYLNTYGLKSDSLNTIINDKDILNVPGELSKSLNQITLFSEINKLSEEKALEAKQLVLNNIDIKKIEASYNAYEVIVTKNASLSSLTLKEIININEQNATTLSEIQQVSASILSSDAIAMLISYEKYSGNTGNTAIQSIKNNINNYYSIQKESAVSEAPTNGETTLQESGTNIESMKKSIDSAYNISKYNKEEIDATTGAVKNDYSALQLEGKNGLDLNISVRYDSLDSGLKAPDYTIHSGSSVDYFSVYESVQYYVLEYNGEEYVITGDDKTGPTEIAQCYLRSDAENLINSLPKSGGECIDDTIYCYFISYTISPVESSYSYISTTSKDNYNYNYNKIGLGWQFNFSSIETNAKGKFLHLGDGRTYKINGSSLEDYDFKDIVFYDQSTNNTGAPAIYTDADTNTSSRYVLEYKDKTKEYFTDEGRLLAVIDKYGNKIRYQNTVEGSNNLLKIIDTRNRVVEIKYSSDKVELKKPSGDLVNFNLENKSESFEGINYNYKVLKEIQELSAYAVQSRVTSYAYNTQVGLENTGKFSYESNGGGLANVYAKLNNINYSTGASTVYTYEKAKGYLGNAGYFDYYRATDVVKNSKVSDLTPYKAKYLYEGDYTKDILHKTTKTVLGDSGKGTKTIFSYNVNHTMSMDEVYAIANNAKLTQNIYEYDSRKMPKKQTTTVYYYDINNVPIGNTSSVVEMEYDIYKDKTWDIDVNGVKTIYDYNSKYHQIENVRKNIEGQELRTENIINTSTGSMDQTIVYHKENGIDKPMKSLYEYNPDGTVKKTTNSSNNNPKYKNSVTEYLYNDNYVLEGYAGKTYSITSTTKFKDSDLQEKTLTEISVYDYKTSNLICSIDGKGNKTTYQYDFLDRSKTMNYPDVKKADGTIEQGKVELQYFDNTNTVISKDENNHHTMNTYDGLGRLLEKKEVKKEIDEKSFDISNNAAWYTVQKNEYNSLGQLVKSIDGKNNNTIFQYDELGREIKRTFANNAFIETKYTYAEGRSLKITYNEEKEPVEQYYDNAGNVIKEIVYRDITENNQALNNVSCITRYEYNKLNQLVTQTDARNNSTTNNYDDLGRLTSIVNAKNEKTAYEYDNMNNIIKMVTDQGSIVDKEYNELGKLIKETMKEDATSLKNEFVTYDEAGNVKSKIDKAGVATNFQYDSRNRVTKESKGNIVIYYDYSNTNNKKTVIKEVVNGQQINRESTIYEYYADGKLKKETTPDSKFIEYKYDENNNRRELKDHFAKVTTYSYDCVNKLRTVDIDGKVTNYDYYNDGVVKEITYPNAVKESYTYTRDNNIKTLTNQKGDGTLLSKYVYTYDKNGNQISKRSEEAKGIISDENYNYDELNRVKYSKDLKYTTNTNGIGQTTSYTETAFTFDKNGNILTKITNDDYGNVLNSIIYDYDLTNKLKTSTEALQMYDTQLNSSSYSVKIGDTVNLQLSAKFGNGQQAPASYFASAVWSSSLPEFKLSSTSGQSVSVIVAEAVYNKMIENQPVKISAVIGGKTFAANIYKSTPTMIKQIQNITISPDKYAVNRGGSVTFTVTGKYNDGVAVEDTVLKDAVWTSENSRLKLKSSIGKTVVGVYDSGYVYSYSKTIDKSINYAITPGGTGGEIYDRVPLKVNVKLKDLTATVTIDGTPPRGEAYSQSSIVNESVVPYGNTDIPTLWPALVVKVTTKFYYDSNGNLTSKAKVQGTQENILEEYSYNILNQLQSYKNNVTGNVASYNYFVDGLRKSKTVGGTTTNYYNDGSNVIIEADGNNNLVARNIIGLKNIGRQESNGNINYFLYNAHGDIAQFVGNTGEIINNYQYDIYGKEKQTTENIKNPIRYAGQYYDEESGLYYLRARYYSPEIMRFISEDSYRGDIKEPLSLNLYGYCEGDPIAFVDPSGNAPEMDHEPGDSYDTESHGFLAELYYRLEDKAGAYPKFLNELMLSYGVESKLSKPGTYIMSVYLASKLNFSKGEISTEQQLQLLATKANQNIPGQGTVAGTLKHTEFAKQVKALNNPFLKTEITYKNGKIVSYGTKGGVRLDVVEYNFDGTIKAVYDLKTGKAGLTSNRVQDIQAHLPNNATVYEIRP
jgi:RHS repeat-associated protein